jgi:hypothetical protein
VFGIIDGLRMGCRDRFVRRGGARPVDVVQRRWAGRGHGRVVLLVGVVLLRRHVDEVAMVDEGVVRRLLAEPVFAHLPAPATERLARDVATIEVAAGDVVVPEGGVGDHFFLLDRGEASVTIQGRQIRTLSAGGSFGEIALLRDVPRTATVTATSDLRLLPSRDVFLRPSPATRSFGVARPSRSGCST